MNYKINFRLFSVMFALSFALLFFMRDWGGYEADSDAIYYLRTFQMADSRSFSEIYYAFVRRPHGNEPFWYTYVWLFRKLIGDHVGIFAILNYFIILSLTAYLGKVVDEKRFVVIILCILFVDLGFFHKVSQTYRHMFALLLFLTGIFSLNTNKNGRLSRTLMYSSIFFHLVTLPLVALFEFFSFCAKKNRQSQKGDRSHLIKWYSIEVITYAILFALILKLCEQFGADMAPHVRMSTLFSVYSRRTDAHQIGVDRFFHPLSYLLVFYFFHKRKLINKIDLFIGINYFIVILGLVTLDFPTHILGRTLYVLLVGVSILVGKLMLADFMIGSICILTMIFYQFHILSVLEVGKGLPFILSGGILNPARGLVWMIYNSDSILVLPVV